jgi:hypothetical protein
LIKEKPVKFPLDPGLTAEGLSFARFRVKDGAVNTRKSAFSFV